jgi:hypothetical protein
MEETSLPPPAQSPSTPKRAQGDLSKRDRLWTRARWEELRRASGAEPHESERVSSFSPTRLI